METFLKRFEIHLFQLNLVPLVSDLHMLHYQIKIHFFSVSLDCLHPTSTKLTTKYVISHIKNIHSTLTTVDILFKSIKLNTLIEDG